MLFFAIYRVGWGLQGSMPFGIPLYGPHSLQDAIWHVLPDTPPFPAF